MYTFVFDVRPINVNNYYTKGVRFNRVFVTKSKEYVLMERHIDSLMTIKFKTLAERFNHIFVEDNHYLVATWRFYTPDLLTKSKKNQRINKKSSDLSNIIKPVEDCLFKYLNADDSHVVSMNVYKIQSDDYRIECDLEIKDLNSIL